VHPAVALVLSSHLMAAPTRIAVLEVTIEGGADPSMKGQITGRIADLVGRRENVHVIAPDDIRAILEKETEKQLLGCDDQSCLAEIGGALGADILIKGRVSKLEDGYGVSLSAVDATNANPIGRASETWGGESIGLLELVAPMIDRALAKKGETLLGSIEVTGAGDGAQIFVDDQVRGTAPAGQMGNIDIGARRVRVVADGYQPFEAWVVVKKDQLTTVPVQLVELESAPFYATWWFWTITGAAVVGGATAAAVLLTRDDGTTGGTTGVNVSVNADTAFTGGR
jgi:hypothetical protein